MGKMDEEYLLIDGRTVDPRTLQARRKPRPTRTSTALVETPVEDEILSLHLLESMTAPKPNPTKKAKRKQLQIDGRGLELRLYLGSVRPYYARLSLKKQRILRLELEANIAVLASLYPTYPKKTFIEGEDLDLVHTYYENFNQYSSAIINAAYYRQFIIIVSAVLEGIAVSIGFKRIEGFTKAQVEVLPIYESLVLALSRKHGAGIVEGMSVEFKLMMMLMISLGIYGTINYLLPSSPEMENRIKLYGGIMNGMQTAYNMYQRGALPGMSPSTATPAPIEPTEGTAPPPGTEAATAEPPANGIPKPSVAAPALDIPGMIRQVVPMLGNLGPILSMFTGGGAANQPTTQPAGTRMRTRPIR